MTKVALRFASMLVLCVASATAQAPAVAPASANGICKDGTYSMAASKSGACRGHKGVQTWYAAASGGTDAIPAPTVATATPAVMPVPVPMAAMPAAVAAPSLSPGKKLSPEQAAAARTAAPGGGPGLVWVNTGSNVYHCYGDVFYGKTKAGAYMPEADAKAKGAHGERGKSCSGK